MKFLKFAFVMTVMVIGLISCQKDDEPKDEPKSVAGTWEGKWGYSFPVYFIKWDMEMGGDLSVFSSDGTLDGVGSWDQDGDEIEVHYTVMHEPYDPYSRTYKGTYDEDDDKITGNWDDDILITFEGTFEMYRQ